MMGNCRNCGPRSCSTQTSGHRHTQRQTYTRTHTLACRQTYTRTHTCPWSCPLCILRRQLLVFCPAAGNAFFNSLLTNSSSSSSSSTYLQYLLVLPLPLPLPLSSCLYSLPLPLHLSFFPIPRALHCLHFFSRSKHENVAR